MAKWIRIFYLFVLIAISLIIFLFFPVPAERYIVQHNFKDAIRQNKNEILISDLTDFDWDAVCVLEAYAEMWQDKGRVGDFPIKEGVNVPYFYQEREWGLAFVNKGQVVKAFEVDSPYEVQSKYLCANKASAVFKKTIKPYGPIYIFLDSSKK